MYLADAFRGILGLGGLAARISLLAFLGGTKGTVENTCGATGC